MSNRIKLRRRSNVGRPVGSIVETLETRRMLATLTTLVSFNGTNGENPWCGLTLSGNTLYGTTERGGANNLGTVFSVPVTGGKPTVLASMSTASGTLSQAGLALVGNTLYGTTNRGGANDAGTVFSVPVTGGTPTSMVSFNGTNGRYPAGGLTLMGNTLYGTTWWGGSTDNGTIFSIPVTGGAHTTLATFGGSGGSWPAGLLTISGNTLYGTTTTGGSGGSGTVFSVPVTGGTPNALATFNGPNGDNLQAAMTHSGKTLYGTTLGGGASNLGTVFSIPLAGGPVTTLVSFNGTNGANPWSGLTLSGNTLYGMTENGGANNLGTIFSIPLGGGPLTTLVSFNGTNGANPRGDDLTFADNTLYGTTISGGANGKGTVFKLTGFAAAGAPEAAVFGNNVAIVDGDTTPAGRDWTNFGTVNVGSPVTRTFKVRNTGTAALTTRNLRILQRNGPNAPRTDRFTITEPLAASIPPGASDTFTVRFNARSAGDVTRYVFFNNNDSNENPYHFAIRGKANTPFAVLNPSTRVLTVTGTSGSDFIRGSIAGDVLTMRMNSLAPLMFNSASRISRIVVNALGGNDNITMATSVNRPTSLNGGDGNDSIYGGSGADVINGGAGFDFATRGTGDVLSLVEEIL